MRGPPFPKSTVSTRTQHVLLLCVYVVAAAVVVIVVKRVRAASGALLAVLWQLPIVSACMGRAAAAGGSWQQAGRASHSTMCSAHSISKP